MKYWGSDTWVEYWGWSTGVRYWGWSTEVGYWGEVLGSVPKSAEGVASMCLMGPTSALSGLGALVSALTAAQILEGVRTRNQAEVACQ